MHSKCRYKICICSVILGKFKFFSEFQEGLQYYFLENFKDNLTYYESENFSDFSLYCIFDLGFLLSTRNSLT